MKEPTKDSEGKQINRNFEISVRPGCQEMLENLSSQYELILFTASSQEYMNCILNFFQQIFNKNYFSQAYSRYYCKYASFVNSLVKDLTLLTYEGRRNISNIVIVDNKEEGCLMNFENCIPI